MADLKALREQRAQLITDMRAEVDKADAEKRAPDTAKLATMKADALRLKETITTVEDLENEERAVVPESQRQAVAPPSGERRKSTASRRTALLNFTTRAETVGEEDLRVLHAVREQGDLYPRRANSVLLTDPLTVEQRAQNTLSLAAGGAIVAPDISMYGRIIDALKFYGGMEQVGATVLTTDTGADLPIATDDDTSNVGAIVAEEGSQAGGSNVTMGQVVLHAYLYSSKVVKISWQLLQDSSFDVEGWLGRKLGMRLGRILNTHQTTGTGNAQPQGLVTGATVGRQSAVGNTTTVQADDVLRLIRSVDVAYRNANCRFMMSDSSALQYELLKDGNGQYIWRMGNGTLNSLGDRSPDTLRGYSVVINNDMPTMAANAKHTSFGDHSNYYSRRVRAIQLVRINELYVESGQVGFLAFLRADGGLVDAGQHPVKLLQNSAT